MAKRKEKETLQTYRIRAGMTLRALSKITNLSAATLYRVETGKFPATIRFKILLQDGLGITARRVENLLRPIKLMRTQKKKKKRKRKL